jgi:hypothetical protein
VQLRCLLPGTEAAGVANAMIEAKIYTGIIKKGLSEGYYRSDSDGIAIPNYAT